MKEKIRDSLIIVLGIVLLATGIVFLKVVDEPQGIMQVLSYIGIGFGCGLFGGGIGDLVGHIALEKNPQAKKMQEIEEKDERNQMIGCRAKAKAFDMMMYVFGILMIAFAMIGMEVAPVLMLVCAYLFVIGYGIYYRFKFEKEM